MNKTKKSLLTAGSIITLIACGFAILMSILMFLTASVIDEEIFIEIYKEDPVLTYYEDVDGDYYLSGIDEDGEEIVITENDVEIVVETIHTVFIVLGIVDLAFAVAKLTLAIKILVANHRDKHSKGCTLALFVLSIITMNLLEAILLLVANCIKDNNDNKEKPLGLDDIIIEDAVNQ